MTHTAPPDATPPSTLHGSLDAFPLFTVLALLATTGQTGELDVLSDRGGGRVWVDGGRLANAQVGEAATIGQAVFDLARVDSGEFAFHPGRRSSSGQPTVPVDAVLDEVRPLVERWQELVELVPLDSLVGLEAEPAGPEVHLAADQWRALSAVAAGPATVRDALDQSADNPLDTLLILRTLFDDGLVTLDPAPRARPRTRAADVPVGAAQDRPDAVPVPETTVRSAVTAVGGHEDRLADERTMADRNGAATVGSAPVLGGAPVADAASPVEVAATAGEAASALVDAVDAVDAPASSEEEVEQRGRRIGEAAEQPSAPRVPRAQTPWTVHVEAPEAHAARPTPVPPTDPSAPDPESAPVFGLRRLAEVTLLPPPSADPWSDAETATEATDTPDSTEPSRPAAGRTGREARRGPASQGNGAA